MKPILEQIIVDVRTLEEFADGHIDGSIHFDFYHDDFKNQILSLNKNNEILRYCRSGQISGAAAQWLQHNQYLNVNNLGSLQQAALLLKRQIIKP